VTELLRIEGLRASWGADGKGRREVLLGLDLELRAGETLGLVGASGSGKTTLGRILVGLLRAEAGHAWFRPPAERLRADPALERAVSSLGRDGAVDLTGLARAGSARGWRPLRRALGLVFQDPGGALDPRLPVWRSVAEPLEVHGLVERRRLRPRAAELLEALGIPAEALDRRPSAFSGGQRQRIGIARALATDPLLLICDEPTSALDVSVQAQILELLVRLQEERGLTVLFISHDLAVVRQLAHRVAVLDGGRIVEEGPVEEVFQDPRHPLTRAFLEATPTLEAGPAARGREA